MKLSWIGILGAIALSIASCNSPTATTETPSTPEATQTEAVQNSPATEATAAETPASEAIASGSFVSSEKRTQGMAKIVAEGGQTVLVFDDTFTTGNGPDVFVLLHKEANPQNYSEANFVNLGGMKNTSGTQSYAIPSDVNPADFRSAVIWCRKFNATFGYAPLAAQ